ncbi:hypothetical protein AB0C34_17020 [Nocardia sp. NPDC049220]|uniref:hypothetical protein n=1 Tax=Nocardia sp. NPDC049220 TaxID=3155273 RepID=UPI0033F6279E
MSSHPASDNTPISPNIPRWVLLLPADDRHDRPRLLPDPDTHPTDPQPLLFDTEDEATIACKQFAGEAADLGVPGWSATPCRYADIPVAPAAPPAPVLQPLPSLGELDILFPPPLPQQHYEFALVTAAGLIRDADAVADELPYTLYLHAQDAYTAAADYTERAHWLGRADYTVRVVMRIVTTHTTHWAEAIPPHAATAVTGDSTDQK